MTRAKSIVVSVSVITVLTLILAVATYARIIRWSLPDQAAMTRYLEETPFEAFPELSNRIIASEGDNKHLCFMCSVYGVTLAYDLSLSAAEGDQGAFCDRVHATLAEWQGGERVVSGPLVGGVCTFKVERVEGHDSWRMTVAVRFETVVLPHVTRPPGVVIGLHDSTFD